MNQEQNLQTENLPPAARGTDRENARYRHELKYNISYAQYLALRQRIRPVMQMDPHVNASGLYQIRSIYFDNFKDKALREKTDGVPKREKFRIRYYNEDFSFITLEKKIKYNDLCMKFDAAITEQECRKLLNRDLDWMKTHPSGLVQELYAKMAYQMLRPRVLVSYVREPYVYAPGNVRVTFDSQIRTTLWHNRFLEPQVHDISATELPGERILEVKYDDFFPELISHLIQSEALRQQAFSKYGACRRYG